MEAERGSLRALPIFTRWLRAGLTAAACAAALAAPATAQNPTPPGTSTSTAPTHTYVISGMLRLASNNQGVEMIRVELKRFTGESVINGDLRTALRTDALLEWWGKSKNAMRPCQDCALRYACVDCTAVEMKDKAKSEYCPFDPNGDVRVHAASWEHSGFIQRILAGPTEDSDG